MPRRRTRPLTGELKDLSIKGLKVSGLLEVGSNNRMTTDRGVTISTSLASRRTVCRLKSEKHTVVIGLESRRLGGGLVWYFKDPTSGKLCTRLFFSKTVLGNRKTVGALYRSQFQDKMYRLLIRIGNLIEAIRGVPELNKGPGRGSRKLKNVERLQAAMSKVISDQEHLDEILDKCPRLGKIPQAAIALLRRELPKLPKGWPKFDRLQKKVGRHLHDFEKDLV